MLPKLCTLPISVDLRHCKTSKKKGVKFARVFHMAFFGDKHIVLLHRPGRYELLVVVFLCLDRMPPLLLPPSRMWLLLLRAVDELPELLSRAFCSAALGGLEVVRLCVRP
mmetsp:Transcript_19092/g.38708  ORF Transcript_19092/g.38708 Transcript_19092/m.38708 type:complete len:110 (+) Transcript_19092:223-552(+)